MWIEIKGRQHRVYWRTDQAAANSKRAYEAFNCREDAQKFVTLALLIGLPLPASS